MTVREQTEYQKKLWNYNLIGGFNFNFSQAYCPGLLICLE